MYAPINHNIVWEIQLLYKLERIYKKTVKFIGILGLVILLIILSPIVFIVSAIAINLNNEKRLTKLKKEFEQLTYDRKNINYNKLKVFNERLVRKILKKKSFFLVRKFFKNYVLLQDFIEDKYFKKIPQKLLTPENSAIIDQMQKQFADGWNDDEMNVFDFTYAENEI